PSDPLSLLQLDADVDWNADSGAPYCIPIKLADNTVVYSAGVGSVVFNPVI
ncbi:hypothetical protein HD554DRAFT_1992763, partial [Boletus coccyginus]